MKGVRRQWDDLDDYVLRRLHANRRGMKWIATFMCCAVCTIERRAKSLDLKFNGRHHWTVEEDALLRARYPEEPTQAIAQVMGMRVAQVHQRATRLGLHKSTAFFASDKAGRIQRGRSDPRMMASQFKKGLTPWNKGAHYVAGGRSATTRFKKGQRPHTWKPVGSYRVNADGFLDRKVSDTGYPPRDWVGVHRLAWIAAHGPIPRGYVVRFRDGCKSTVAEEITVDKLELITMQENMRRNTLHRYPKEVVGLIQMKGALNRRIHRKERQLA